MGNTVYITGASGLVARYVISDLLSNTDNKVVAVSSCPNVVKERHSSPRLESIGYGDFFSLKGADYQRDKTLMGGGVNY